MNYYACRSGVYLDYSHIETQEPADLHDCVRDTFYQTDLTMTKLNELLKYSICRDFLNIFLFLNFIYLISIFLVKLAL